MKTSQDTNEISAALSKAQGMMDNPDKSAKNPHFGSTYADLAAGLSAIRVALSANGIAFIQTPRIEDDLMMLDTRLTHSSDQYFECEWPVCKLPAAPQLMGSALTYARRYSLFSIVGIAGEDDDGNAASASTPARDSKGRSLPPKPPIAFVSAEQARQIGLALTDCGKGAWEPFSQAWKISRLSDLLASDFDAALAQLRARVAAKSSPIADVEPKADGEVIWDDEPASDVPQQATAHVATNHALAAQTAPAKPTSPAKTPPTPVDPRVAAILADLVKQGDEQAALGTGTLGAWLAELNDHEKSLITPAQEKAWRNTAARASA